MPAARVRSIKLLRGNARPDSPRDSARIQVRLEDGSLSSFVAATPDCPAARMKTAKQTYSFSTPILFVEKIDEETLGEAVVAMAEEMSGYWLRYYNSPGKPSRAQRSSGAKGA